MGQLPKKLCVECGRECFVSPCGDCRKPAEQRAQEDEDRAIKRARRAKYERVKQRGYMQ